MALSSAHNARQSCGLWGDCCCQFRCMDEGLAACLTAAISIFPNCANSPAVWAGQTCRVFSSQTMAAQQPVFCGQQQPRPLGAGSAAYIQQLAEPQKNCQGIQKGIREPAIGAYCKALRRIISSSTEFKLFLGSVVS